MWGWDHVLQYTGRFHYFSHWFILVVCWFVGLCPYHVVLFISDSLPTKCIEHLQNIHKLLEFLKIVSSISIVAAYKMCCEFRVLSRNALMVFDTIEMYIFFFEYKQTMSWSNWVIVQMMWRINADIWPAQSYRVNIHAILQTMRTKYIGIGDTEAPDHAIQKWKQKWKQI